MLQRWCESFRAATGWELQHTVTENQSAATAAWRNPLCGPHHEQVSQLALFEPALQTPLVPQAAAIELAERVTETLNELYRTRSTLWSREAELATAVPLLVNKHEEGIQLARRLEAVLQSAVQSLGATSAALYLLDDDTRYLKLRAHFGLDDECFVSPPRRLRGSKGDLEALTGHAVVLERPDRCSAWDIPHPAAAAICVPVATSEIPLGTMWVFADSARQYSDAEVNLIEVIAGRLAVELEREILLRERILTRSNRDLREVASCQRTQWSCSLPQLDGWALAAEPQQDDDLITSALSTHWQGDSRLGITLAAADRGGIMGSLAAASVAAAARAHQSIVQPKRRLHRIQSTFAGLNVGDQTLHAACGTLDLENGKLTVAGTGDVDIFVVRTHSWEPLHYQRNASTDRQPKRPAKRVKSKLQQVPLAAGDAMLMLAGPKRPPAGKADVPRADAAFFAEGLLRHHHLSVNQMVKYLSALSARESTVWHTKPAILVAKRLD